VTQNKRTLIAVLIIALIAAFMLGIEALRGQSLSEEDVPPGSIPIYLNDDLVAYFAPTDLKGLEQSSFVDAEEGKTQEGWLLRDILPQHLSDTLLKDETQITVSSSSREKSAELSWVEAKESANSVLFDLSSQGTLKLTSTLERLDTRDEWVQDVDRIDVRTP
jgi:hypothetical protein